MWSLVIAAGVLGVFALPIIITKMVLGARRSQRDLSAVDLQALRDELAELRHEMETSRADLTLMIEDVRQEALPAPADDN